MVKSQRKWIHLIGLALVFLSLPARSQNFHLSAEPLYYLMTANNAALDYKISDSWSLGFQFAQLEGGREGRNLSGFQAFYSRKALLAEDTEVLKLYLGRLSPQTQVLGIHSGSQGLGMAEILYGYRWVFRRRVTLSVQAGAFFTRQKIYPSISVPVGIFF